MNKQHKINMLLVWLIAVLITIADFLGGKSLEEIIPVVSVMFGSALMVTGCYALGLPHLLKGIFISTIPSLATLLLSFVQHGNVLSIFCALLALYVTTLYFNKVILLVHAGAFLLTGISMFAMDPVYIVGKNGDPSVGIVLLIMYALLSSMLYMTTIKGNRLVKESLSKSELAAAQHEQILERNQTAKEATDSLRDDVVTLNTQVHSLSNEACMVEKNKEEITAITHSFSRAFDELNQKIALTKEQNSETYTLANRLKENYQDVLGSVNTGSSRGETLASSIFEMSSIINDTLSSTNALLAEANTIHSILGELNAISGQTNLLALNASIEAARVGTVSSGFGIVAEQIRELSEESKKASTTMNVLLSDLTSLITTISNKVTESVSVIEYSITTTKELMSNLKQITISSNQSSKNMEEELASISVIHNQFEVMTDKLTQAMQMAKQNEAMITTISNSIAVETEMIDTVTSNIGTISDATNAIAESFHE